MDKELTNTFINYFANKYLASILPKEVLDTLDNTQPLGDLPSVITEWESKVTVLHHWENVITKSKQTNIDHHIKTLKQALFEGKKVWIGYEGQAKRLKFNPFGLVIRDQQYFIVGSYWDNQEPYLLSVRKIIHLNQIEDKALSPDPQSKFKLSDFAIDRLNKKKPPIEKLEIEFPIEMQSYIASYPLVAEDVHIIELESKDYFKLTAHGVENSSRLHQWLSGFHENVHIIKPEFLRQIINKDLVDNLTDLYNRNYFDHLIRREIHNCFRNPDYHFSLLTLDIDHFKTINDTYGHNVGDEALQHVANTLRKDEAIRYGGEEFYVFLSGKDASAPQGVAERIRKSIEKTKFESGNKEIYLTISIGIAQFPGHLSDENKSLISDPDKNKKQDIDAMIEQIKKRADDALYYAKATGRNKSIIYKPGLQIPFNITTALKKVYTSLFKSSKGD